MCHWVCMTIDRSKVVAPQIYIYLKLAHQVILSAIAGMLGVGEGVGGINTVNSEYLDH